MGLDPSQIEHEGVVREVRGDLLKVAIQPVSACGSCAARGACFIHEGPQEKVIDVVPDGLPHAVGDRVVVVLARHQGYRALMLGYLFPFGLVFLTLIVSMRIFGNEVIAGILSIGILIPYYIGLYVFRHFIKRSFVFRLKSR